MADIFLILQNTFVEKRRSMQAVIIAGGFGTRMASILGNAPKSLAPIQNDSFIKLQMKWLGKASLVHLCLGYKSDEILSCLEKSHLKTVSFTIENRPLGVIGSLHNALSHLDDVVAVLLGDVLPRIPFLDLLETWVNEQPREKGVMFLASATHLPGQKGNVKLLDTGRITYSKKRSFQGDKVDIGFWILPKQLIEQFGYFPQEEAFFQELIKNDLLIGLNIQERSWEIGSPQGLKELQEASILCGK